MSSIAIVGIGCRFAAGIDSPESFWEFILHKGDGVTDIPAERWDYRRFYDPDKDAAGRMYTRRAAFLDWDPWNFDSEFFGMSPREATSIDPQQRLILEVAWEALDDAGIAGRLSGRPMGVYVGSFATDHAINTVGGHALPHTDIHTAASADCTMLSNRLAYVLNVTGPALTVNTACSSSLVALHLACQGISNGDCDMALAGGVNMLLRPETFVVMCKGGFLAEDGRCKSFSASADGYGRGEGSGMVVLRRLEDALRDGDRIYGVVEATGSNQDGRTPAITVPNGESQAALARSVCARSGIAPHDVTYVEAHGTGTPVGDPIELGALGRVYGAVDGRVNALPVGSVKATLGHTEAAAGIASVVKSALAIHHRILPPQGWCGDLNPEIPFDDLRLTIQTEPDVVDADVDRMVVAVNGFGYGGTNAHAIIAERPVVTAPTDTAGSPSGRRLGVFPLSARSEAAVRELAGSYLDLLDAGTDPDGLETAVWTRRAHHRYRVGVPYSDAADLADQLGQISSGATAVESVVSRSAGPVLVFSGMGPQWWAMARDLLNAGGAFASVAAEVDAVFRDIAGWSIIEELMRSEEDSRITSTAIAQPANFLVQVGLTAELAEFGIEPSAIVGHSVGEVSAAYVSGTLSLRDALLVSYYRGKLQATTAGTGSMLAIGLPADEVRPLILDGADIDIAAINSASSVTVSGDADQLEALAATVAERGVFVRNLRVEVPYHSRRMDPILGELKSVLAGISVLSPKIPLYSTVTGDRVTTAAWDGDYWCANVREPVRFADATKALVRAGHRIFVEVGPHPVLGANIREILLTNGDSGAVVSTLKRGQPDDESIRMTLAGLYNAGAQDVAALFPTPAAHIGLPRYPWQRQHLRNELPEHRQLLRGTPDGYSMLGDADLVAKSSWELRISEQTLPWLSDHIVNDTCVLPGAAYLDAALSAATVQLGLATVAAEDVHFVAPLVVDVVDGTRLRTEYDEVSRRFTIRSCPGTGTFWTVHATGRLINGEFQSTKQSVPDDCDMTEIAPAVFYPALASRGLAYGANFQRVTALRVGLTQAIATVDARSDSDTTKHRIHPCVVDAAFQTVAVLIEQSVGRAHGTIVPVGVDGVRAFAPFTDEVTVVAHRHREDPLRADIVILDAEYATCAQLLGVRFGSITPGRGPIDHMEPFFYEEEWDLLDPLREVELPSAETTSTLVVALGDQPRARAQQLSQVLPHASFHRLGMADLESELAQQLWAASTDLPRLHLCLVAGDSDDDINALWALQRVAIAIEKFLDERFPDRSSELDALGDDTFYVTLVTERAFVHSSDTSAPNPSHAGLAGARRVLLSEQTQLRWRLVDIEPDTSMADLITELSIPGAFSQGNTDEVFLRNGLRWSPVVTRTLPKRRAAMAEAAPLNDPDENFAIDLPKSRIFADIGWRRCRRRSPGEGQVELRMIVIGLTYKDAVKALGLLGERELEGTYFGTEVGMEGIGVVTEVGPGVTDLAIGDAVISLAKGMMTRYLIAEAAYCRKVPAGDGMTPPEACASILAFGTSEYALKTLARLKPGETVLIHGAAGGVGSAGIQVAKSCGAHVIGTARTDERRSYVLAAGADHALDSRSLNFVDDVLELTNGDGVDVVMSTAPGEILRHNFKVIGEFGRIVEIGKTDIYMGAVLDMSLLDKNVSYFSMDLDRIVCRDPDVFIQLAGRAFQKFAEGTYRYLPANIYPTADVAQAFEDVFRSDQIGRVAVRLTDDKPLVKPGFEEVVTDPEGAYLITGGYGGLGLATGRWLVRRGARNIILASRSGATTDLARQQLRQWRSMGVEVTEETVDIADGAAAADLVNRCHIAERPLRGIFHAAGAVADQRLADLDLDALKRVYQAKVEGGRALWSAVKSAGIKLHELVFFSSGGSLVGVPTQYSYTAANLAVQSLTEMIIREGQPAVCIGWGHMSGTGGGMAADETAQRFLTTLGFDPIDMDDGPNYLEESQRLGVTQAAIIPTNWSKLNGAFGHLQRVRRVEGVIGAAAEANSAEDRLRASLLALDEDQRGETVARMLTEQLADVMGVSAESIDIDIPVTELGLDSLMAVEFGLRTSRALGVQMNILPMGRVFDLRQAGTHIAEFLTSGKDGGA